MLFHFIICLSVQRYASKCLVTTLGWGGVSTTCGSCQFPWCKYSRHGSRFQATKVIDDNEPGVKKKCDQSVLMSWYKLTLAYHCVLLYKSASAITIHLEYNQREDNSKNPALNRASPARRHVTGASWQRQYSYHAHLDNVLRYWIPSG